MNQNRKTWRQTASTEDGYVLQSRQMTPDEWGQKLTDDICSRPDFYFARVEIPRLDQDVNDYLAELWDIQRQVRQAQLDGLHYRSVGRNCQFCQYFEPCSTNNDLSGGAPIGFEFVANVNPELDSERISHVSSIGTANAAPTETAAAAAPCIAPIAERSEASANAETSGRI